MAENPKRYTISGLSRLTGLSVHTLRFYEKEGILRRVERTPSGRRVYGEDSVACLIGVLCLKQGGLTLAQVKEFFDQTVKGVESLPSRLSMMLGARDRLEVLRDQINRSMTLVNFFIDGCRKALEAYRKGEDADAAFPFITLSGIAAMPCMMDQDGKWEPNMRALLESLKEEKK